MQGRTAVVLGLGYLGILVANLLMVNPGSIFPLLRAEFGVGNIELSLLLVSTSLVHTFMQLPCGQIVDRLGGSRSLLIGMLVLVGTTTFIAIAPAFMAVLVARCILGIGSALAFTAGVVLVNQGVPGERRALAQGIFGASANLGFLFALGLTPFLALLAGWRVALLAEGALAVVVAVAILSMPSSSVTVSSSKWVPWGAVLGRPVFYLLGLAHVTGYGVYTAVVAWGVTLLTERHGLALDLAGSWAALLGVTAVVGRIVGGALANGRERQVMVVCAVTTGLLLLMLPVSPSLVVTSVVLLLLGATTSLPFGSIFGLVGKLAGPAAGRATGVANFIANLGALAFPPIVGASLDLTGGFHLGFWAVGLVVLASGAALWHSLPRSGGFGLAIRPG
ncbi:MAG TPA: MFS transporter [Chloroflexota bacterium]